MCVPSCFHEKQNFFKGNALLVMEMSQAGASDYSETKFPEPPLLRLMTLVSWRQRQSSKTWDSCAVLQGPGRNRQELQRVARLRKGKAITTPTPSCSRHRSSPEQHGLY